jgi:tetratricopeptide (TPR) repeat protein
MAESGEYKPTWFDRNGPDAGTKLRAYAYGAMVFGITMSAGSFAGVPLGFVGLVVVAAAFGAAVSALSLFLSNSAGAAYRHLMVNGSTTPYKEQYSYQQALVMQGRIDEALESFEAVIAETPDTVDARAKAAELYARDKGNVTRAAELFREIQRLPSATQGEDIYATNRLCDLLTGPLNDRGRALVEFRRLVAKYPGSAAAHHARSAIASLKPEHHQP